MITRAMAVLVLLFACTPAPAQFVEQVEVRVVNVDVTVTDGEGNPLTGLGAEDFELVVDGQAVEISHFSRVAADRVDVARGADVPQTQPAGATATVSPVTWAIFLDRRELRPSVRNKALQDITRFLERTMQSGDRGILATFDGQGFRVRGPGLTGRDALLTTIRDLRRDKTPPGYGAINAVTLMNDLRNRTLWAEDLEAEAMVRAAQVVNYIQTDQQRTKNAMVALSGFLDVLGEVEGRQALIYVGPGFATVPGLAMSNLWHQQYRGFAREPWAPQPREYRAPLETEKERLFARISASRVVLYAIYTGGTGLPSTDDRDVSDGEMALDAPEMHAVSATRELAERTGGRFLRSVALDRQLETVRSDMTHYYSLAFVDREKSARPQKIEVRVKRPGAVVRHRRTAGERSRDEAASDAVVAALFNDRESNRFGIVVETGAIIKASQRGQPDLIPVRVRVPLDALTFLPDGDLQRAGVTFHFALAGADGTIWRLDSRELPLNIARKDFATALRQSITYSVEVPAVMKDMRLAVSVQDRIGQVRSVVIVPVR